MMKKVFFLTIAFVLFFASKMYSQDKYDDPDFDALKIVKVIDPSGFKPFTTSDTDKFKAVILGLSSRAFVQLNIDTWAKCTNEQERIFLLYNSLYKKVTRSYFNENCKALCALMLLDGTLKSR